MNDERRKELFEQGQRINPTVGNLFQNPMPEMTKDDLAIEYDTVLLIEEQCRWYKDQLMLVGVLL